MNPISSVIIPVITGTGAPSNAVGVNGQYYYDGTNGFMYGPKAAGAWTAGMRLQDNVTPGSATGQTMRWNGSLWVPTNIITITDSGFIGINTAVPGAAMEFFGLNRKFRFRRDETYYFDIFASSYGAADLSFGSSNGYLNINHSGNYGCLVRRGSAWGGFGVTASGHFALASYDSSHDIIFYTNNFTAEIFRINAENQNVQIGTSSGTAKLAVKGSQEFRVQSSTTDRQVAKITPSMPVSTDASRTGRILFSVSDYAASREVFQADADGTKATAKIPCSLQIGNITGGHYAEIEADGTVKFVGNATVFEDLNFDPDSGGGPAATLPDYVTINNVIHREFTSSNNQLCGSVKELPHAYKLSSTLFPHWHGFLKNGESAGTTGVTFTIYWELRQAAGVTSGSVALSATSAELTNNAYKFTVSDATGFAGSAELGGQLALTLSRTGGDAGDIIVTTYGIHYEIDTVGSREITTK